MENNVVHQIQKIRKDNTTYNVRFVKSPTAKVYLIDWMKRAEQTLAKVVGTYSGVLDAMDVSDKTITKAVKDMHNTQLRTPLEMMYIVWLITDVSRAFTHQLVRTRVGASYAQESMRFLGMKNTYSILTATNIANSKDCSSVYTDVGVLTIDTYELLLKKGIPSQDARGILPTNILTAVFFGCALSTLANIYKQRMCCQAQAGEWQDVLTKMKDLANNTLGANISSFLKAPYEYPEPCGFEASFDRPCIYKDKNGISE